MSFLLSLLLTINFSEKDQSLVKTFFMTRHFYLKTLEENFSNRIMFNQVGLSFGKWSSGNSGTRDNFFKLQNGKSWSHLCLYQLQFQSLYNC